VVPIALMGEIAHANVCRRKNVFAKSVICTVFAVKIAYMENCVNVIALHLKNATVMFAAFIAFVENSTVFLVTAVNVNVQANPFVSVFRVIFIPKRKQTAMVI